MEKKFKFPPSAKQELKDVYEMSDEEILFLEDRLNLKRWEFGCTAQKLRISLSAEEDTVLKTGKVIAGKNLTAQFQPVDHRKAELGGFYDTRDVRIAELIYLSEPYKNGRAWDKKLKEEKDAELEYVEFRERVLSDPEKVDRLKKDLAAV